MNDLKKSKCKEKYLVCITGASGSIYGLRLIQILTSLEYEVHIIVSKWGEKVIEQETEKVFSLWVKELRISKENIYDPKNLGALPASGSFKLSGTIIVPCSINSIGIIASGASFNLIHRAAQVALKEGYPLLLVPRETPLSLLAIRNLCTLSESGAIILPASPAFYHKPKSIDDIIDFVVGKILDRLSISHNLNTKWEGLK